MKTSSKPSHINASINNNYTYTSPDSKNSIYKKIKNPIKENKENINYNTKIKITNKNNYKKLKLNLQKKPIKKKFLRETFEKSQNSINLDNYKKASLKIFEPNSFNNISIHYTKHKNQRRFNNNDLIIIKQGKTEEQKINDNFEINSPRDYTYINNDIKKEQNSSFRNYNSIENDRISNQNQFVRNSNFSYLSYKTAAKKTQKKNSDINFINKTYKNNNNFFSPPKLELPQKISESIELNKTLRYLSDRRNNEFESTFINPDDFKIIKQIGFGSFGKIYKTLNIKNCHKYVLKVMHNNKNNILYMQDKVRLIMDFEKRTKCNGLIKIYGDACIKKGNLYHYYEVLELADRDWEQEIIMRRTNSRYYSEYELIDIMSQLIKTLSLLQKNHITHRDIKLQNILLLNNQYKICDFGEARKLSQKGVIIQPVRGSELYMSPIQFFGLEKNLDYVQHNTYKSDVFSLGMCILFAANLNDEVLYDIREITDMKEIKKIVMSYLGQRYSSQFINLILVLLEYQEKKRPDFILLEKMFDNNFKYNV